MKILVLYTNIDLKLRNKLHGPMHCKIDVTWINEKTFWTSIVIIDGASWNTWGSWTACASSCGIGLQSRRRSCSKPVFNTRGQYTGISFQKKLCLGSICPGKYTTISRSINIKDVFKSYMRKPLLLI